MVWVGGGCQWKSGPELGLMTGMGSSSQERQEVGTVRGVNTGSTTVVTFHLRAIERTTSCAIIGYCRSDSFL